MVRLVPRRSRVRDERGAAIVLFGLASSVMIGISAFVIDLGYARQSARQAQGATDAGSLAGSQNLPIAAADPSLSLAARDKAAKFAAASLFSTATPTVTTVGSCTTSVSVCTYQAGNATITVTSPYVLAGSGVNSFNLIHVRACRPTPNFLAQLLKGSSPPVCREAIARRRKITGAAGRGLITLAPSECDALVFSGDSETQLTSNGAVIVDSSCPNYALSTNGVSWDLQAGAINVTGGVDIAPCGTDCTDGLVPVTGVPPTGDPLINIPVPAVPAQGGTCSNSTHICTPGFYPAGIDLNSSDIWTFQPGVYYLNGAFRTNGNMSIVYNGSVDPVATDGVSDGVLIYMNMGELAWNGNGVTSLPPPQTGPWQGITIFQSRTNTSDMQINGTALGVSLGSIYAKVAHVDFLGTGQIDVTGMVVVDTGTLSGTFNMTINVIEPPDAIPPTDDIGLER
jgi:Flp pilus assembly protein TadG